MPVLIGSNSGEGILNAGDYIQRPELLGEEFSDVRVWDEVRGEELLAGMRSCEN